MRSTRYIDGFREKCLATCSPTTNEMATGANGLHRCPLELAGGLMPYLAPLFLLAPVENRADWFVDVKVHMLFRGQYPCIPNWHCDNVPRDDQGTNYSLATHEPTMFIWLSDTPATEVVDIDEPMSIRNGISSHDEIGEAIRGFPTRRLHSQTWYSFSQLSPHRGSVAVGSGWRVFVRLTHADIASKRPVRSVIRRHSQVYLDAASFSW